MGQHFKIITTCCNGQEWISRSILSLIHQTYEDWNAVVVDALSEDETYKILNSLVVSSDKITLVRNKQRRSSLSNSILGMKILAPQDEDVLVFLDGDDWFYDLQILEYLAKVYADPNIWVTWGSYETYPKHMAAYARYSLRVPRGFNVRKGPWSFSHLKTCKYFLWKSIRDEDLRLKRTKEYYPAAQDLASMFPMVEMAGKKHRKFIDKPLMVYNTINPKSDRCIHKALTLECNAEIRKRAPYSEQTKESLLSS